jgi:hypothetical protein
MTGWTGTAVMLDPSRLVMRQASEEPATATLSHTLNPLILSFATAANPADGGEDRGSLNVPVSPVASPNDTTLFEQPADPAAKLFLPRYRVVQQPSQQVFLAQGATDWTLTVDLEKYRAPEIESAAADASELPHSISVVLRFAIVSGNVTTGIRELAFSESTDLPNGVRVVCRGTDTVTRDQVYLAMTDQVYATQLLVHRAATVAVPIASTGGAVISSGQGVLHGTWMFDFDSGTESGAAGADVWWDQQTATQRQLVPQGVAGLVSLAQVNFDALAADDLAHEAYGSAAIPGNASGQNALLPSQAFAVHTGAGNYAKVQVIDYGYDLTLRWVTYAPPAPPPAGAAVISSGQGVLRGTWLFNFDEGAESSDMSADVWWEQQTATERQLVPRQAQLANLGSVDFAGLTPEQLAGRTYSSQPIPGNVNGPNNLTAGCVFAVRTRRGSLAKVQVVEYGYNLTLRWVTYAAPRVRPPVLVIHLPVDTLEARGSSGQAAVEGRPVVAVERLMPRQGTPPGPGPVVPTPFPRPVPFPRPIPLPPFPLPPVPAPQQVRYKVISYTDELSPAQVPFIFPAGSPVFVNVGDVHQGYGLERHDVPFNGGTASYYRDLAQPWVFYFLPDEMRLARRFETPHTPAMTVQMNATDDTLDATTVTLAYAAMPYVDGKRLDAAAAALAPLLPASLPAGASGPVLQALQVGNDAVSFALSVPKQDGTTGAMARDHAIVDLRSGVADALTMSLADFRPVYQALFSDTDLFRGDIEVRLGAVNTEHVRLAGRLSETAGAPILDGTQQAGGSDDIGVMLTNAIESPVHVANLTGRLARGTATFPATIEGLTKTLPTDLDPAASLGLSVTATNPPVPGTGSLEAVLDLSGVTVHLAADSVWHAILSPLAPNEYAHEIILEVFASAFAAPPDHPDDAVIELNFDFLEGSTGTVQVTPQQLPAAPAGPDTKVSIQVTLHMPILKWLLNEPDLNEYSYRVTVVRPSGTVTGPWTRTQDGILPIQTVPAAAGPAPGQ